MELLDLINDRDEVIGQVLRADAHTSATLAHRTVHFTLVDSSSHKILVSRRAFSKKYDGGSLCFLGEHVLSGESYEDAVRRGVQEELGIEVAEILEVGEHIFSDPNFLERVKMFLIECNQNTGLQPDPDELVEVDWYARERLRTLEVSDMTRYWIDNVDWKSSLS